MPPQKIADLSKHYKPFFSQDWKTLYGLNVRRLFFYPVLGNQSIGERTFLYPLVNNTRNSARVAVAAIDGKLRMKFARQPQCRAPAAITLSN